MKNTLTSTFPFFQSTLAHQKWMPVTCTLQLGLAGCKSHKQANDQLIGTYFRCRTKTDKQQD